MIIVYGTLTANKTEEIGSRTDRQTDRQTICTLRAPPTFRPVSLDPF
jgi:hypothetical protein